MEVEVKVEMKVEVEGKGGSESGSEGGGAVGVVNLGGVPLHSPITYTSD